MTDGIPMEVVFSSDARGVWARFSAEFADSGIQEVWFLCHDSTIAYSEGLAEQAQAVFQSAANQLRKGRAQWPDGVRGLALYVPESS